MTDTVTLGVQSGDEQASEKMQPFFISLRKLLARHCVGPYSDTIDEFAIVLRIDGRIWHWHFEGTDKLRLNRKGRYVTIDIGVLENLWRDGADSEIRSYLGFWTKRAIAEMIKRIESKAINVRAEDLRSDVSRAVAEFEEGN